MPLKQIFTVGERATYKIAQQISHDLNVEALAKVRIADAINIQHSGISAAAFGYALKAHFDVLLIRENLPVLAIEFDGPGHDKKHDDLKNSLCDRFGLPLVRVGMIHLNSKNFEDTAVHFLIHQLFCVDAFLEHFGNDPYEPYDPIFFVNIPGKDRRFPFAYADRWRGRLIKRFKENLHLFAKDVRINYANGLLHFDVCQGAWARDDLQVRAFCGQSAGDGKFILGSAELSFQVFGMTGQRREYFLDVWEFVMGLAAAEMYELAIAFLDGDAGGIVHSRQIAAKIAGWETEGFTLRIGRNLPHD